MDLFDESELSLYNRTSGDDKPDIHMNNLAIQHTYNTIQGYANNIYLCPFDTFSVPSPNPPLFFINQITA